MTNNALPCTLTSTYKVLVDRVIVLRFPAGWKIVLFAETLKSAVRSSLQFDGCMGLECPRFEAENLALIYVCKIIKLCSHNKSQFVRSTSCISSYMFRLVYRAIFRLVLRVVCMYTRVNKNPSAWNFLSPKPEVTCVTVAIIIRVVLLSPYLRIRAVLCPPFITINHTAYILTEDDNTFA